MDGDNLRGTIVNTKSLSLNNIHPSIKSLKSCDMEYPDVNISEKSYKIFCKINANEYAQLSTSCQNIYEDHMPCISDGKLASIRIDLHGKSIADAKKTVIDVIQQCHASKEVATIHIISGHGKHKNTKGERGTIFKSLPKWFEENTIALLIKSYRKTLGAYEVILNSYSSSEPSITGIKVLRASFIEYLANLGDMFAQYMLGCMHLKGDRVNQDEKLAADWLGKSADQGFDTAQLLYGYLCAIGKGTRYDPQKALSYYRKSAAQGNTGAMLNIATIYFTGEGVEQNYKEAAKWYLQAGKKGEPKAMNMLGIIYRHGYGVKRDDAEAVRWDRKGAEAGSPHAKVNLGTMLLIGRGVQRNPIEGVKWLREGADYGLPEGQLWLGRAYEYGDGVEQDYFEAYKLYLAAALQNKGSASDDAYFYMGQLLEEGKGVEKNIVLSNHAYLHAAKNDHVKAQEELGHHFRYGIGFAKDYVEAVKWYRLSAKKGNPGSQYSLGEMYELGQGVPYNPKQAQYWIEKSAEGGHTMGLIRCGIMPPNLYKWLQEQPFSQHELPAEQSSTQIENDAEVLSVEDLKHTRVEKVETSEAPKLLIAEKQENVRQTSIEHMLNYQQFSYTNCAYYYGTAVITFVLIWYCIFV